MPEEKAASRREEVKKELGEEQRKNRVLIRQQAELLEALINHPGWKVFQTVIAAQAQNHMGVLQKPLNSPDEVMKQEYTKGTLNGLSTALMTPQATIEQAKQIGVFHDPDLAAGKE